MADDGGSRVRRNLCGALRCAPPPDPATGDAVARFPAARAARGGWFLTISSAPAVQDQLTGDAEEQRVEERPNDQRDDQNLPPVFREWWDEPEGRICRSEENHEEIRSRPTWSDRSGEQIRYDSDSHGKKPDREQADRSLQHRSYSYRHAWCVHFVCPTIQGRWLSGSVEEDEAFAGVRCSGWPPFSEIIGGRRSWGISLWLPSFFSDAECAGGISTPGRSTGA